MPCSFGHQEAFPYDALDEIFCFGCENRLKRALALGTVCRFWYDRFLRNDRMWELLSCAVVKIPRPKKALSTSSGLTDWNNYTGVRRAMEVTKQFSPLPAKTLHTINRCLSQTADIEDSVPEPFSPVSSGKIISLDMKFRCPLVLEALTLVEPGVAACHLCDRRVYKVRNQEELDDRARKGDCVWIEPKNVDTDAKVTMDVEVALFCEDFNQAVKVLSEVANDTRVIERSASMFPMFVVRIPLTSSETVNVRFTTFCFSASDEFLHRTSILAGLHPDPKRFTFIWFQPPSTVSDEEKRSWVPTLKLDRKVSRAEKVKFSLATAVLRQDQIPRQCGSTPQQFLTFVVSLTQIRTMTVQIVGGLGSTETEPSDARPEQATPGRKRCCCCSVQ